MASKIATLAALAAALPQLVQSLQVSQYNCKEHPFKRVVAFSIDGMHSSDVEKWVAHSPKSTIATLLKTGYEYTNAYTSAPSDSFPGVCAFYTGSTPRTTGVWYDDTWDRSLYAPSDTSCASPGAEIVYDESIDYNSTELFSGGINPANLPRSKVTGKCAPLYPHNRLRVNTIFEIAQSHGLTTAYTDKHPAYDLVRGPSGKGLTVGYFPEIAAFSSSNLSAIIGYDKYHVKAFLEWLDGKTPAYSEGSLGGKIPSLMGGNFQAVSVAQKVYGYEKDLSFTPELVQAFTFVDNSIGKIVKKLKAKGLYEDTLITVASKHGQAPINPALYGKVDPTLITNATGVDVVFQTSDDIALIFLKNQADLQKAVNGLNANRSAGKIRAVIYGQNLTASGYGDPKTDPAVPDIIVQPELGIIYTTSTKKIAEHGGISSDDRLVAAFASNPKLKAQKIDSRVYTTQFAPTVLEALGLPVSELQGAQKERTKILPGFTSS